jgi:poly(A) polymerase
VFLRALPSATIPRKEREVLLSELHPGMIVARGINAGPDVARILRAVEARWVREGFPNAVRIEALLSEELG